MAKKSPKFQVRRGEVETVCNIAYVVGVPRTGHTCTECGEIEAELLVSHVVAGERFTSRLCEPCAAQMLGTTSLSYDDAMDDIVFVGDRHVLELGRPTVAYRGR
jgi:hypothetical protein